MRLLYSLLIIYLCFANNCLISLDLSALDTGVGSQGCSVCPRVADRRISVDEGCQVIIRIALPWSIVVTYLESAKLIVS
jgi:hypothetical protein